ncbi:type II toxin-antitoxin system RelE/ParE family toxin [Streptomyces sp. NPDC052301]|uniref:type II toxin-antitoxin system RelE/ParE family toxin n=1 Tax=Streptomyces sp. NPDC052301 TaxID=3365687 RepID=UPI0037D32298
MRYEVIREPEALVQAERLAKDDPGGVRLVFAAVDRLGDDPGPTEHSGSPDLLRIHVGAYRVAYEISDRRVGVTVIRGACADRSARPAAGSVAAVRTEGRARFATSVRHAPGGAATGGLAQWRGGIVAGLSCGHSSNILTWPPARHALARAAVFQFPGD